MYNFNVEEATQGIIESIREYFEKNGSKSYAVVGISGGKDSTIVAALCILALGQDRVLGILMPDGSQDDIDVSYNVVDYLGIPFFEVNIGKGVKGIRSEIPDFFYQRDRHNRIQINTPARVRELMLYDLSDAIGGRVMNTCNLSESWVGYSTKLGDNEGDFSPLHDFTVTEVLKIGEHLGLLRDFVYKTPTDGLCGQTDEEKLGFPYYLLDIYIRTGEWKGDPATKEKIDEMHRLSRHKVEPMPYFKYQPTNI